MASLLHSLSSLSLSSPQQPTTLTLSTSPPTLLHKSNGPDIQSGVAYSFKRPYNVQVTVHDDDTEESLVSRFRREVFRANIIQECKRRMFFETSQEKRKRKARDAARRRSRRRPRPPVAKKEDVPRKKRADEEQDNWDVIDVEVPYSK